MLRLLTLFVSWFSSLAPKAGGGLDPSGILSGEGSTNSDTGGGVDPNGRS